NGPTWCARWPCCWRSRRIGRVPPRHEGDGGRRSPRVLELEWADELFVVLASRALWWPRRATLLIADPHLGKPAAFRSGGVPVPERSTTADLDRLGAAAREFRPDRLVI